MSVFLTGNSVSIHPTITPYLSEFLHIPFLLSFQQCKALCEFVFSNSYSFGNDSNLKCVGFCSKIWSENKQKYQLFLCMNNHTLAISYPHKNNNIYCMICGEFKTDSFKGLQKSLTFFFGLLLINIGNINFQHYFSNRLLKIWDRSYRTEITNSIMCLYKVL